MSVSMFLAVCEFVIESLTVCLYDFLMFILACFILKETSCWSVGMERKNVTVSVFEFSECVPACVRLSKGEFNCWHDLFYK